VVERNPNWTRDELILALDLANAGRFTPVSSGGTRIVTMPATSAGSARLRGLLDALEHGQLFWFADWPVAAVPGPGAMVYTVWNRAGHFICRRLR
jgi:hypothetical protein